MPVHPAQLDPTQLLEACETRRQRRSGPGGQHRNKVETGIFIEHRSTGIRAEATEKRSQQENLYLAIQRLRVNLAIQHRSSQAIKNSSRLWQSRVRAGKIGVSELHVDFASMLSEAMDVLQQQSWNIKTSADLLGCSTSQLVKFLKKEPRALAQLNQQREQQGLGKLK